jgi:hypothetical protein
VAGGVATPCCWWRRGRQDGRLVLACARRWGCPMPVQAAKRGAEQLRLGCHAWCSPAGWRRTGRAGVVVARRPQIAPVAGTRTVLTGRWCTSTGTRRPPQPLAALAPAPRRQCTRLELRAGHPCPGPVSGTTAHLLCCAESSASREDNGQLPSCVTAQPVKPLHALVPRGPCGARAASRPWHLVRSRPSGRRRRSAAGPVVCQAAPAGR